jgi:hypothetical protein
MNGLLSIAATAILAALAAWAIGGWVLRTTGAILAVGGLLSTAATGAPTMVVATLVGAVAWLAGHWLYAVRHHYFRAPLARRIFLKALPSRLDPTRRWGVPTTRQGAPRC